MSAPFSFILAAGIILGLCVLFCIAYVSYKIKEVYSNTGLLDARFPSFSRKFSPRDVERLHDVYQKTASDARMSLGCFYTESRIESLRKKSSPHRLPLDGSKKRGAGKGR
ncbi:MAG TPA: hypothetical protein H9900_00620 [Candidatus Monoglobus merdigallinarum]|uniref:Uncharacterized protein n=1 Tax=Candidatus Monoglobus merdigallinarum TaxID=2838698 RepID=A0A9D1TLN3_9FIRM|nr:hypothetical protein [Candidatus Monoglobus merdigallinarum]